MISLIIADDHECSTQIKKAGPLSPGLPWRLLRYSFSGTRLSNIKFFPRRSLSTFVPGGGWNREASGSARLISVNRKTVSPMRGSLRLLSTTVCNSGEYQVSEIGRAHV